MKRRKPLYLYILSAAVVLTTLAWYVYPRSMEQLMVIPEDISVNAMYWETEKNCISMDWEEGSPEAKQVRELLHSTRYAHVPALLLPLVDPDYLTGKSNSQQGAVILILEDGNEQKYLVAFFREHMNYNDTSKLLKTYFVPMEENIRDTLVEMVVNVEYDRTFDDINLMAWGGREDIQPSQTISVAKSFGFSMEGSPSQEELDLYDALLALLSDQKYRAVPEKTVPEQGGVVLAFLDGPWRVYWTGELLWLPDNPWLAYRPEHPKQFQKDLNTLMARYSDTIS